MNAQKSCFTVHGSLEHDFESLFNGTTLQKQGYFRKYLIPQNIRANLEMELDVLGISYGVIFPGLGGLSLELKQQFRIELE